MATVTCEHCDGLGYIEDQEPDDTCPVCDGEGVTFDLESHLEAVGQCVDCW